MNKYKYSITDVVVEIMDGLDDAADSDDEETIEKSKSEVLN